MIPLHFEQPQVRVDNSVWVWLTKEKLDRMKLSTDSVVDACQVTWESFSNKSRLVVQHSDDPPASPIGTVIHNLNTAADFKSFLRSSMLDGMQSACKNSDFKERVYLVSFADLKTYVFTYNVAVPSLSPIDFSFEAESVDDKVGLVELVPISTNEVKDGQTLFVADLGHSIRTVLTRICLSLTGPITVNIETSTARYVGVRLSPITECRVVFGWVKWPKGDSHTTVQSVDLKRFLDPATIARDAVNLNVKLIKWRLIPELEPSRMSSLKFLLLGAGTLGCAVARCLLAWGVENIVLVDSGHVSYSNLARQWLFRLEDAQTSSPKAEIAAERLREILPSVNAQGVQLSIPLPGHPQDLHSLGPVVDQLEQLVEAADVVFMLTDSRESRWLPSLLVAQNPAKLGISVALGFDSYLVKTHALSACYFCNDVSAPSSSTNFRTLDQQCTVTRPGLAAIASCVAVELVANLSQSGFSAPRSVSDRATLLGAIPDQIRGFLGSFTSFPAVTEKNPNCICCSDQIVTEFKQGGIAFVEKVVSDAQYLMQASGMAKEIEQMESLHLDDFALDEED